MAASASVASIQMDMEKKKSSSDVLNKVLKTIFPVKKEDFLTRNYQLGFQNLEAHINHTLGTLSSSKSVPNVSMASTSKSSPSNSLKTGYMKVLFGEKKQKFLPSPSSVDVSSMDGRVGHSGCVVLQSHALDTVPGDNLAVIGSNNFQSVKASHAVYKGKWMYEVLLGTSGLMQIGWCTGACKFNREEGVGDTKNSFAFDGYREAKWNARSNVKYGESWEADDIVTCLLDLDQRTVSFCLNGNSLGVAFTNVPSGPGVAYFPGLSLALKEVAYCNFGNVPFRYPQPGFRPLQDPPDGATNAQYLVNSLITMISLRQNRPELNNELDSTSEHIIYAHIFQNLLPLMKNMYNVVAYLFPYLLSLCHKTYKGYDEEYKEFHFILRCMWQFAEMRDVRDCINNLFGCALRRYRSSPVHVDFSTHIVYLQFILGLLKHSETRRHLALHCSFDRQAEIPALFYIKQVSKHREAGLSELIPMVWGQGCDPKTIYEKGYIQLKEKMDVVRNLQGKIMKLMVLDTSSINLHINSSFVKHFRKYLETLVSTTRPEHTMVCHPIALHSFMQHLLTVTRDLWNQYASINSSYSPAADAFIPLDVFYNETIDYFDLQRVGGLKSHLFNEHKDALAKEGVSVIRGRNRRATGEDTPWGEQNAILQILEDNNAGPSLSTLARADEDVEFESYNPVLRLARVLLNQSNKMAGRDRVTVRRKRSSSGEKDGDQLPTKAPLLEITDGCLLLFSNVIYQHMDKIHSTRTKIVEYATSLTDIEMKIQKCTEEELDEVQSSLSQSHAVLLRHLTELCRSMAWLKASVYPPEYQNNLWWLLQVSIRTVHKASGKGPLFTFLPEFYLSTTSRLYKCLREYFSPSQPFESLSDLDATLSQFVHFLSVFHCDSRVVNNDIKTTLANTITTFITYPLQLRVIEQMPDEQLHTFVRNLLYAYDEDKPWTSVGHRLLATLWRGSGFAMRFDHPPYVRKVKTLLNREHDPYVPSKLLLYVREHLLSESKQAAKFVHSILEHLNWSFSEFIAQLQEVHKQNSNAEWNNAGGLLSSLDAQALRQLRIVDMLFELSVSLMRVLELSISVAPDIFLDWPNKECSETLIYGLIQCLNQILQRVTLKNNLFNKIVTGKRPGLSSLQHYPLMTAAAGILIRLVKQDNEVWKERAVTTLITDPGFNIESIQFLLDLKDDTEAKTSHVRGATLPYTKSKDKKFRSLEDYEEVMDEEVETLRDTIFYLRQSIANYVDQPMDENNLCPICYANESAVEFLPCHHTSCRHCINQQLMSNRECFFCKAHVDSYRYIDRTASNAGSSHIDQAGPSTSH